MRTDRYPHAYRRAAGARVRHRPLPRDVRHNHFVSHAVWRPRWVLLLAAAAVVAAVVMLSVFLGGCGAAPGGTDTTGPGDGDVIAYPDGKDDLVFRVGMGGGFVPVEYVFTNMPWLSVYGDGRVITQGPIPEIYPGPALPNLQVAELSPDGIRRLLTAARDAGLFETGVDYGQPAVADGSTTTFTVVADGSTHETSIYHLGPENASDGALTAAQVERRMRVVDFQSRLFDLPGWLVDELGSDGPFEWQALSVLIMPGDPASVEPSDIEPRVFDWPLGDLATLGEPHDIPEGRRAVISGADLETLRPLVQQADQLTFWRSGDRVYSLLLRPLLPDEIG